MAAKAHILAILFPLQGHINPMVQLCKRLIAQGIRVTLLTTVSTSKTLQTQQPATNLINIETVPDRVAGVEHSDIYEEFFHNFKESITRGLPEIIKKHSSCGFPVKAILYDSVIPWTLDIAHVNGLKGAMLFTQTCTVCSIFYHLYNGTLDISSDEDSDVLLPGLPVLRLKDLPSFVYEVNSYTAIRRVLIDQFSTFEKADWRLFNTFDKLEEEILKWMATQCPILTIGPAIPSMYTDKRIQDNYEYGLSLFIQKADQSCIEWLNTKEDQSVIYISFGSLVDQTEKQIEELGRGLIDSECNFLWIVRNTEESKLPQDFTSKPPKKGLIVNWCHQLEVLSHPSIGCFITHCGWNSTLEALSLGVPMVAMPQWTDQTTNAKLIVDVWKAGIRVKTDENGIVTREEIVACVKEVMHGERGCEIKRNVVNWRDMAKEAVSQGGTSDKNVVEFVAGLEKDT